MKAASDDDNFQKQHFVPESYLREFTNGKRGFFHQLNISNQRLDLREVHVQNVCYSRNFYDIDRKKTLQALSLSNSRYLETSFTYENSLIGVFDKIRSKQNYLSRKEFELIVEAYLSIKHRGPRYRKEITKIQQEGKVFDQTASNIKTQLRPIIEYHHFDYDSFIAQLKQEIQNDPDYARAVHLSGLVESSRQSNEPVFDAITKVLSMNIVILEAKEQGDHFFVSDNPGYSLLGNKMFNTNYGSFDKIVWPINSKQIILLDGFDTLNYINPLIRLKYIPVNSNYVQEVNKMTFLIADEKIFCEDRGVLSSFKSICNSIRDEQQKLIARFKL